MASLRELKKIVLLLHPFQTFKENLVRSVADYIDNGRETSVITHNRIYTLCKKSLEELQTNGFCPQ